MSYILEALRKVEQQREELPAHGLLSRRRYYSALDGHVGARHWLFVFAAMVVAALSGMVAANLITERDADASAPAAVQSVSPQAAPPVSATPQAVPPARPVKPAAPAARRPSPPPPLQPVSVAPPRLPGPRYQPTGQAAVQAPRSEGALTQSQSPQEGSPEGQPVPAPEPQTPPETKQPTSPAQPEETELATVATPASPRSAAARHSPAPSPRDHAGQASAVEPLDRIPPPKSVEVQPFRPHDVLRPPAARRAAPASEPPLFSTLSSQFQSMVPKMTINAQVYSTLSKQRFVVINMKRYNEGQSTADGVTIESIRQHDIIFAYHGQRFRLVR